VRLRAAGWGESEKGKQAERGGAHGLDVNASIGDLVIYTCGGTRENDRLTIRRMLRAVGPAGRAQRRKA
jgi:hypothetical protein